nr:zinc finger, CCHC-type [Tanacetum cinerariifolium]
MVLELVDKTISKPTGVAGNVFVKVGKFYFPADFVVLDFITDPRVPLILGRPFLSSSHAIINVHEREIILRQDQQSLIIQCGDIPSIKKVEQINKIDFIDAGGIDFDSEEIKNFLNDDSIPFGVEYSPFNMEEDILFLESLLIEEPCPKHPIILNQTIFPIEEPKHSFKMGYEHFNTNLVTEDVAESSTKNLVPIPHECKVTSENGSESIEPVNNNSLVFTTISNSLFDDDKINSDEINSHVESNSDESTSNHDIVKFGYLDEFYTPLIPIYILEEIRREHADYINRMEIVENDDSDEKVDAVDVLLVDNFIQNFKYEYSESEDSDFDNPPVPLPPPEPPDEEFDFRNEIFVVRSAIIKFECIDARVKFDVFNDEHDDLSYFMFVIFGKEFSFLFAESEDIIFDPVGYLSKWVEAKALPTNDARVVVKFLKSLFSQFGTPKATISDKEVYPYGTAKLVHSDGSNFKVNCHHLKHYHGGNTPPLEIPDFQTAGKGGNVTEVELKRMAGISGLNATVLAIQTGKEMLPSWNFVLGKVEEGSGGVGEWWRWVVEWERAKELWDSLKSKYIAEDDSNESISVSSVIEKLPPSWKDFKHTLKHGKDDFFVQLGSHLRIKEYLRTQESDKGKGKEVVGPSYGKTDHFKRDCRSGKKKNANASGSGKGSKDQSQDQDRCWFKTYEPVEDGYVLYMGDDHFAPVHGKGSVVYEFDKYILSKSDVFVGFGYYNNGFQIKGTRLPHMNFGIRNDPKRKSLGEKGIECIFIGYAEHSKAYRFYVIEANDYVSINSIIKSRDAMFIENHFSSIPRPNDIIPNSDEFHRDDHLDDVTSEILEPHRGFQIKGTRLPHMNFGIRNDPKRKSLGEKGIECIFIGYAEHSKAYRFYVIEANDYVSINSIIKSRDAMFIENHFSSIPRPNDIIPNSDEFHRDDHLDDVTK